MDMLLGAFKEERPLCDALPLGCRDVKTQKVCPWTAYVSSRLDVLGSTWPHSTWLFDILQLLSYAFNKGFAFDHIVGELCTNRFRPHGIHLP